MDPECKIMKNCLREVVEGSLKVYIETDVIKFNYF